MDNLIQGPWKTMREYDMTAADKRGVFLTQTVDWRRETGHKGVTLRTHRTGK